MEDKKIAVISPLVEKKKLCPRCRKEPFFWRSMKQVNKAVFTGTLVYYTAKQGAWGTPEESREFLNKLREHIRFIIPFHISNFFWPINGK
jgi:hypothetical protein